MRSLPSNLSIVDVDALAAFVDARIKAALAERGVAVEYSSTSLPPGVTARAFARWCRTGRVAAVRDGHGWRCSAEAWRSARAAGPRRLAKATGAPPANDVDSMLRAAGLRGTR